MHHRTQVGREPLGDTIRIRQSSSSVDTYHIPRELDHEV